jgi:hypothetical protein
VSATSPVATKVCAGSVTSATSVPAVGLAGGTAPAADRIITPVALEPGGFVQLRPTEESVDAVTKPATASGRPATVMVACFTARFVLLPLAVRVKV